jgi:amino acid transporter
VVAVVAMARGDVESDAPSFSLSWFNPVGLSARDLLAGVLLGIFCYWGWESGVNLNEETADAEVAAGKSAVVATVILVITYVGSAVAVLGVLGLSTLEEYEDDETLFGVVGNQVLGPFGWLLMLAIITSGLAATQTTILPASRTALSMAVAGAFPDRFQRIDPRRGTPAFATWVIGFVAAGFYVVGSIVSENFLFDAISALSILVALYYALTGFACAIYWRRQLLRSLKAFVFIGLAPVLGGLVLIVVMVATAIDQADPANSYTGATVLGVGAPLGMAIVIFGTGLVLQVVARVSFGKGYFARVPFERVPDDIADNVLGPRRQARGAARPG